MALDVTQARAARCETPIQLTLAGPGSGKTTTLVGRYEHLIEQGFDPRAILALTFTRKAAAEMRDRVWRSCARTIQARAPELGKRDLPIATFHAFALAELKRDAEAANGEVGLSGLRQGFRVLAEKRQQRAIFSQRGMWWRETGDIVDLIANAKERLLDAFGFEQEILADPSRAGERLWQEAIRYFQVYQAQLRQEGAVDFADFVPRLVATMDRHAAAREAVTGRFRHVLVDEYQDVNPGQHLLLDRFVADGVRLWAVGDDDQTLFSFRSSDVRLILGFADHYRANWDRWNLARSGDPDRPIPASAAVEVHRLERNYRSHAAIVGVGQRLIGANRYRLDKPLTPARADLIAQDPVNRVAIYGYASPEEEATQIARAVKAMLDRGVVPDEIAILYRLSALSHHLAVAFVGAEIPFTIRGGGDLWQSAPARLLRGGLLYALLGETSEVLTVMGNSARGISLRKAIDARRLDAFRAPETNRAHPTRELLGEYPHRRVSHPLDFKAALHTVHGIVSDLFPSAKSAQRGDPDDAAAFDAASAFLMTFDSVASMERGVQDLSRAMEDKPQDVVVLSTIHKAKGLEWDYVFLVGCEDGIMPHIRAVREVKLAREARGGAQVAVRNPYEKARPEAASTPSLGVPSAELAARLLVEEERRIAYVGVTRARLGLCLTHVRMRNNDPARPSPFLKEMLGTLRFARALAAVSDPRRTPVSDPEILVLAPVFRTANGAPPVLPVPLTRSMILPEASHDLDRPLRRAAGGLAF